MILVVGATGLLGSEICRNLCAAGQPVRAFVRAGSGHEKVEALHAAGVAIVIADLKDPDSIYEACKGVEAVIATASSTFSRQEGDSIETVDRLGYLNLIESAGNAGVGRFIYISIPPDLHYDCPLIRAKREVEAALVNSGLEYTVLMSNYFMELWLSPALGFDYGNGCATIYGSGERPLAWVSYRDVAGFAVDSLGNAGARNKMLLVGGPENITPHDVVRVFENVNGRSFELKYVPESALCRQYAEAADPLNKSFAALMLEYANGCAMDVSETLRILPRRLTTVRDYAAAGRAA
jgi:uncharacterized protein YbjT (DUF2867 family)